MSSPSQGLKSKEAPLKAGYPKLRTQVARVIDRARKQIERTKVEAYWQVGKLIATHIAVSSPRRRGSSSTTYGKQIVEQLARDLKTNKTQLYYALEFYRAYPIFPSRGKLTWTHYKGLLSVNDSKKRNQLARRAAKENWSVKELRSHVIASNTQKREAISANHSDRVRLKPLRPGKLNVYRTREVNGKKLIDLGFSVYLNPSDFAQALTVIARSAKKPEAIPAMSLTKDKRYTYTAQVERVIDGDTIWAVIDLGLGIKTRQKLRLRGINTPEMKEEPALAQRAKKALEKLLFTFHSSPDTDLLITTTKSDKYDRYLADLFVSPSLPASPAGRRGAPKRPKQSLIFINQQMIEGGDAGRV